MNISPAGFFVQCESSMILVTETVRFRKGRRVRGLLLERHMFALSIRVRGTTLMISDVPCMGMIAFRNKDKGVQLFANYVEAYNFPFNNKLVSLCIGHSSVVCYLSCNEAPVVKL